MQCKIYDSSALYVDKLHLSNYALLLVVILLLGLITLLLYGIPRAINKARGSD